MSKVKGPCFSLRASGTVGDVLTYYRRSSFNLVKQKPDRHKSFYCDGDGRFWPAGARRFNHQRLIRLLGYAWSGRPQSEKDSWTALARRRRMPAYHVYVEENFKRARLNRGLCTMADPSESSEGFSVTADCSAPPYGDVVMTFTCTDPSPLFYLLIGHFSATPQVANFSNMKGLFFWYPEAYYWSKYSHYGWVAYHPKHTDANTWTFSFEPFCDNTLYLPYAVGMYNGYLHQGIFGPIEFLRW